MGNIEVDEVRNLNALDVLTYKYIIITQPEDAVTFFNSKGTSVSEDKAETAVEVPPSGKDKPKDEKETEKPKKKALVKKSPAKKVTKKAVKK